MKWCLPCAVMHPPMHRESVGENEDGDPACGQHLVVEEAKKRGAHDFAKYLPKVTANEVLEPEPALARREGTKAMPPRESNMECATVDCHNKIYANNKSGFCTACSRKPTGKRKGAKTSRQDDLGRSAVTSMESQAETKAAFVNLRVSEAFLDMLWNLKTPEQKASLLERGN